MGTFSPVRLAAKSLLTLLSAVLIAVTTNLVAIVYFTDVYFSDYEAMIERDQSESDIDPDALQILLKYRDLDTDQIDEYRTVLSDLGAITSGLEFYAKSPPIASESGQDDVAALQRLGIPTSSIERYVASQAVSSFFSQLLSSDVISLDSPEGIFVRRVLTALAIVNILLLVTLSVVAYGLVNRAFSPVRDVIKSVSRLVDRREYSQVDYHRQDELGDLVGAINRLQSHLQLQSTIRSYFLSDLSHELKTPITALKCYLEAVADGVVTPSEADHSFLTSEIERIIRVSERMSEVERSDQITAEDLVIESIEIRELLEGIIREYTPRLEASTQNIISRVAVIDRIRFDRDRLSQIIHNLFSNFIRYAGENTTLTVSYRKEKNQSVLTFSDDGSGVEKSEVELVREKFYQSDKARTRDSEDRGMGVGLSVVDSIVRLHGGSMHIRSDSGKGFEVEIRV